MKRLRSELCFDITCTHVKGHQDAEQEFDDLDRPSQLNVIMDDSAKQFLTFCEDQ